MNIFVKGNRFWRTLRIPRVDTYRRTHSEDDKKKEKETETDPKAIRKGILHDKQQSVHEESFFHKEELEQLKELKKKMLKKGEKKDGEKE